MPNIGLGIALHDIEQIGESIVHPNEGCCHVSYVVMVVMV